MTPAAIMAGIPDRLLRRRANTDHLHTAKELAQWLADRGHRPSLLEVEQERARRATDAT